MKLMSIHATFLVSALASLATVQPSAAQAKSDPVQEKASLAAERRELAEIRLLIGADRAYAAAKERLARLEADLAGRSGSEAEELARQVQSLAREVARALGEAVPRGGQDELDEAVLAALERGEFGFLHQLGRRAAPALARVVRARPDELTNDVDADPLVLLLRFDPLTADGVIGEQLGREGFLWKKRVMRATSRVGLAERPELWSIDSPPTFLGTGILRTLEVNVDDFDVGTDALFQLCLIARAGASVPSLAAALDRRLRDTDAVRRAEAERLSKDFARALGPGLFSGLLAEGDVGLRFFASSVLRSTFREDRSLLAVVRDPDAGVRRELAEWLFQSDPSRWREEERSVLIALLSDGAENVRDRAWSRLENLPTERITATISGARSYGEPFEVRRNVYVSPLPDEVYRSLLASEERSRLAVVASRLEARLCFELLETLGRDPDAGVVSAVVELLDDTPYWEDPDALLRVLAAVLDNPAHTGRPGKQAFDDLYRTRDGLEALLRWLLTRAEADTLGLALGEIPWQLVTWLEPRLVTEFVARVFAFEREAAERFLAYVGRTHDGNNPASWPPELTAAFRELAADESRTAELRLLVLGGLADRGEFGAEAQASATRLFASPALEELMRSARSRDRAVRVLRGLPGEVRNTLILRAVRDPSLDAADLVTHGFDGNAPGAGEIARAVIEQRYGQDAWQDAVDAVVETMGTVRSLEDPETLARAARDPRYSVVALAAIGELRDPRYLPLLSEIVAQPLDAEHLRQTVEALCRYLDEAAAEPLLAAAAKATDPGLSNACLAHLEKIREYQDARERWATRKVRAQTREQVIAELVGQLSAKSDDVKVQAIRALATWEAVEVMPRLIELSASGSKSVAAAARAALERLNAPQQD